jgi:hypothetical protein
VEHRECAWNGSEISIIFEKKLLINGGGGRDGDYR